MKRIGILSIALATAVTIGCNSDNRRSANNARNDSAVGTAGEADRSVSRGDKDFVHDAAIANMAEVELGKMATERSTNADVKKFGQMMVDDHTNLENKLTAVASQHNIPVPTQLDDKHRDLRDKLAKLNGTDFDREYMDAMVDGHEDVVDKLESRVDKSKLAEWKSQFTDRVAGKKVEERGQVVAVTPEKSDNAVTMSVNQWAADAYPIVYGHLQTAKTLDDAVKKGNRTKTQ